VRTEGRLLPAELLRRVVDRDGSLSGVDDESYHLPERRKLGEAVNDSWNRLSGLWWSFTSEVSRLPEGTPTTGLTRDKWLLPLFAELGFGRLAPTKTLEIDGRQYPVSHVWHTVPIHLVGWDVDLDRRTSGVAGAARRSPHSLLQELLNSSDEYLWGITTNGQFLRLLRDNVTLTRQSYVEFDLEAMMNGKVYGDFHLLWMLLHESRFEAPEPRGSVVEGWARESEVRGVRVLDRLREGVEQALIALGRGFLNHPANDELRRWLHERRENQEEYYRELLRFVYRLLFLLVSEDRGLIPDPAGSADAQQRYVEHYSIDRLRTLAGSRLGGAHDDLVLGLRVVTRKLGADEGCPELALSPMGGFLWSAWATRMLDGGTIANHYLLAAVRALTLAEDGKRGSRLIDYANLGSEELGGIYESLLELHAQLVDDDFLLTYTAGHERKTTGSYYTPTTLIVELVDSALDPVMDRASRNQDPERAILGLRVCDPAVGSGHFLIAAGHRMARRLASIRTGDEEPPPESVRSALRDIVSHCLYGIDVNPMAVELCKLSMWMEAFDPGRPLSFLDHHIVCGNALLGSTPRLLAEGIPDDAFRPIEGDIKKTVTELKRRNSSERKGQRTIDQAVAVAPPSLTQAADAIESEPELSLGDVRDKEAAWRTVWANPETEHARLVADAWCASFVLPKRPGEPVLTQAAFDVLLHQPDSLDSSVRDAIAAVAMGFGFLHPHLAFPSVFRVPDDPADAENPIAGWNGGFDVILGNPPWERVKVQEKEWFSGPRPDIASAPNASARKRMIEALVDEDPALNARWLETLRNADGASHFLRDSGRYPLCGIGDVNPIRSSRN
jgi:hypothetical protein